MPFLSKTLKNIAQKLRLVVENVYSTNYLLRVLASILVGNLSLLCSVCNEVLT